MPFQGDANTIFSAWQGCLICLTKFSWIMKYARRQSAIECNYTKTTFMGFHINVVWRQKTSISCPSRAMRELFWAPNKAFCHGWRVLHGWRSLHEDMGFYRVQLYENGGRGFSYQCHSFDRKYLFHVLSGRCESYFEYQTRFFVVLDGFFIDDKACTKSVAPPSATTQKLLWCEFFLLSFADRKHLIHALAGQSKEIVSP
jgi:hypothetical protein